MRPADPEPIDRSVPHSGWVALSWAITFTYLRLSGSPPMLRIAGLERADLVAHLLGSALLAALVADWMLARGMDTRAAWGGAVIGTIGLGALVEVAQVPSAVRFFQISDLVFDSIGAAAGGAVYVGAVSRLGRRSFLAMGISLLGLAAVAVGVVSLGMG